MIAASIVNESFILIFVHVSFSIPSFSKLFLIKVTTSTPRADKSFSTSSADGRLANQSFVAEMTTECFAWDRSLKNNFGMYVR